MLCFLINSNATAVDYTIDSNRQNRMYSSEGTAYLTDSSGEATYGDDGTSYKLLGGTIYGSDGLSYTPSGNKIYRSDGVEYTIQGNTILGTDGSMCTMFGNTISC